MNRYATLATLGALCAAGLTACDYVRSLEQVCAEKLGPTEIRVKAVPVEHQTDFTLSTADLTSMGAAAVGRQALGLTRTQMTSSVTFGSNGVTNPLSRKHCMRPVIDVELAFAPMTMYIAREQMQGSCPFNITHQHELQHVNAYSSFLAEAVTEVEAELKRRFGDKIHYYTNEVEADRTMQTETQGYLGPFVDQAMQRVVGIQAAIDSRAEYDRLSQMQQACPD
jgi:hypothetical protein